VAKKIFSILRKKLAEILAIRGEKIKALRINAELLTNQLNLI